MSLENVPTGVLSGIATVLSFIAMIYILLTFGVLIPRKMDEALTAALAETWAWLEKRGVSRENLGDRLAAGLVMTAEAVCAGAVKCAREDYARRDRALDRVFTSRTTGIPVMLALLAGVFWLTIQGANYPSRLLSDALFGLQDRLTDLFTYWNAPTWLHGALVLGVYRVLAWVVSVMLPPMAIFFPIFTLLEDFGYLPRVAFVLDHAFQKARACGKQADRKSTRLNSSHSDRSRMPSSA